MIKLKQLLESSTKDRLKKRVSTYDRTPQMGKVEKKIRSILNSLPPQEKEEALEEMGKSGEVLNQVLPDPGETSEDFRERFFDDGEDLHQALVALDVDGQSDTFVDFGANLSSYEEFTVVMTQSYTKDRAERVILQRPAREYSFEVELYILILELFSVYLYETRFFGQKIS